MDQSETWEACASDYENTVEQVTSPCVVKLLEELAILPVPSSAPLIKAIDLAAGPGILAKILGDAYAQAGQLEKMNILSTDFSSNMMELAQRQFNLRHWVPTQFSVRTLDATNLVDVPADCYTHAFCTFGLLMIPDASKVLSEMFRVLQPAGTMGITTWHRLGWFPIVSAALAQVRTLVDNEEDSALPKTIANEWADTAHVQQQLEKTGFEKVRVTLYETRLSFTDQHECVQKFTQARWIQPFLQNADLTEEQRARYNEAIPQVLLDMVGKDADEPFDLPMIAVIAHGQKPSK